MSQQTYRANTKVYFLDLREFESKGQDAKWRWWDMYPKLGASSPPNPEHVEVLALSLSEKGPSYWNDWRRAHPSEKPQLSGVEFPTAMVNGQPTGIRVQGFDFGEAELQGIQLHYAGLKGVRFDASNLRESLIMQASIEDCSFVGANLTQVCLGSTNIRAASFDRADMLRAHLMNVTITNCSFESTMLDSADLSNSHLEQCRLRFANLSNALCSGTEFSRCDLSGTNLQRASMVKTKLLASKLNDAFVYGANSWDVTISEDTSQVDLVVTEEKDEAQVKVDDLRVAQFIHLILSNSNIRQVIETIGSKGVLILGRFSEERKSLLEALRSELRKRGFVPIIFDFQGPAQRDFTETVTTLAGLCLFVIADITSPKSVPLELQATVPNLMLPFVPIVQDGEQPFSMFRDLWNKYDDWVLPPLAYDTSDSLIAVLDAAVIEPALRRHELLLRKKARELGTRHVREFSKAGQSPDAAG
jgi:uncharacterized protein YjbI with pentapeptide repeats